MQIIKTAIPEAVIIEPRVFYDARGYFFETFNQRQFAAQVAAINFIQDNESQSTFGVIRGLHYQIGAAAQAKLVRVIFGKIIDAAVDLRRNSVTFGQAVSAELSAENKRQFFIPRGFAHGFSVLSDTAIVAYKCDNYYSPADERGVIFSDPSLKIDWQIPVEKIIASDKDCRLPNFTAAETFF